MRQNASPNVKNHVPKAGGDRRAIRSPKTVQKGNLGGPLLGVILACFGDPENVTFLASFAEAAQSDFVGSERTPEGIQEPKPGPNRTILEPFYDQKWKKAAKVKIELPLQREPNFRRPRRSQNDEKIVFLRSLLGVAGRDLPRGTSGRLQSGSRTENGRQEAPQGRPLGAVFGSFWGADSEVVFGSFFVRPAAVWAKPLGPQI